MDLSKDKNPVINEKMKKNLVYVSIFSIIMFFAGLSSAYIVLMGDSIWVKAAMPGAFWWSSLMILLSSVSFILAISQAKKDQLTGLKAFMSITLILGLLFVYFQFQGFNGIIESGYYFTGPESSITTSYLYVLVLLHLAHLIAGIIIVLIVFFKTISGSYFNGETLGFELALTFWHFLDILWVYLFLFVSFYN